jgi:hypothetical protein
MDLLQSHKGREREDTAARLIEAFVLQPPSEDAEMPLYARPPGKYGAIVRICAGIERHPTRVVISDTAMQLETGNSSFAVDIHIRQRDRQEPQGVTRERFRIRVPDGGTAANVPA